MKQSEKLKVLIDSIKTANELMRKQIEINGRAVELLGEFITEPEQVETKTEIRPDAMYKDSHLLGGVPKDDKAPACLDGKGDFFIKPEDMKAGEWYVVESLSNKKYLFKFKLITDDCVIVSQNGGCHFEYNEYFEVNSIIYIELVKSIRKATQEEILRYFPHELEVPTHGGNDAAYIQEVTDPQI